MAVRGNVVGVMISFSLHPSPSTAVPTQALTDVPIALRGAWLDNSMYPLHSWPQRRLALSAIRLQRYLSRATSHV